MLICRGAEGCFVATAMALLFGCGDATGGGAQDALTAGGDGATEVDPNSPVCTTTARALTGPFWSQSDAADAGVSSSEGAWSLGNVAVNAGAVYVAVNGQIAGTIWRVPLRGGTPARIAATSGFEQGLLLTSTSVVFAQTRNDADGGTSGDVVTVPLAGGEPQVLAATDGQVLGLVADAAYLYFSDGTGTKRLPLAGGPTETLAPTTGALALFAGGLAIANSPAGTISSVAKDGGSLVTLATAQPLATTPVACGDALCWMTLVPGLRTQGVATLVRLPTGGTPVPLVQSAALYRPGRLLFEGDAFFASIERDAFPGGPIAKISAAGGEATLVPDAQTVGLAADAQCLFWADPTRGVFVVAK